MNFGGVLWTSNPIKTILSFPEVSNFFPLQFHPKSYTSRKLRYRYKIFSKRLKLVLNQLYTTGWQRQHVKTKMRIQAHSEDRDKEETTSTKIKSCKFMVSFAFLDDIRSNVINSDSN